MPFAIAPDIAALEERPSFHAPQIGLRRHPDVARTLELPVPGEQGVGDGRRSGRGRYGNRGDGRGCRQGWCGTRNEVGCGKRVIDSPECARAIVGCERLTCDTDVEHGASIVGLLRAVHPDGTVEKARLRPLQGLLSFSRLPSIDGRPRRL